MSLNFAEDIALYLEELAEGTLGVDLFIDEMPASPDGAITVYDDGGETFTSESPGAWRVITIKLRSLTRTGGYEAFWRIADALNQPEDGYFTVGANRYIADMQQLPSMREIDAEGRFVFATTLMVRRFVEIHEEWLDVLVAFAQAKLGGDWRSNKLWPGGERPHVTWRLAQVKAENANTSLCKVSKTFVGKLYGVDPNDVLHAATALVSDMAAGGKVPLDAGMRRYLSVESATADLPAEDPAGGSITVVLSRLVRQEEETPPIMAGVRMQASIHTHGG